MSASKIPPSSKRAAIKRRDAAGHIDPKYAAELRARSGGRSRDANEAAFLAKPKSADPLAEQLGEAFVQTITKGADEGQEFLDQEVPEEVGGPFVQTPARIEFAHDTDASNPKRSKREPFPRT
jgi:hypothetical protein